MQYVKGQRYRSLSEPDLGIGELVDFDQRNVALRFPHSGEQRIYRKMNPPIERYRIQIPGEITMENGVRFAVSAVQEIDGLFVYEGNLGKVPETLLPFVDSGAGDDLFQELFDSPVADIESWELRTRAFDLRSRMNSSPMRGLVGARIAPIPHQLYIAKTATSEPRIPRRLLSDEVGLGKTIEAGLIFHRLKITGQIHRVLILTPESLSHQWMVEMYRRFNTLFTMVNDDHCESLEEADPDVNPFQMKNEIIADQDFIFCESRRMRQILEAKWDLVIIDEAHRIDLGENEDSYECEFLKKLTKKTPGLLLLTATPIQLQLRSHFSRLQLIDPVRFADFDEWKKEHDNYRVLSQELRELSEQIEKKNFNWEGYLRQLPSDSAVCALLQKHPEITGLSPLMALRHLTDTLGTGRSVIRNTRQAIGGFPGRELHTYEIAEDEIYRRMTDEFLSEDVEYSKVDLEQNQSLCIDKDFITEEQQRKLTSNLWPRDEKVRWLVDLMNTTLAGEKVLCLCSTREAVVGIQESLARLTTLEVAVFFEDMPIVTRDRAAAWFAQEDGAQILIASEIGSEGRNFQFASHIVMFDLPLEPGLLEQRIGRLDRIGQKNTIHIHVPWVEESAQFRLYEWYHKGLNAFLEPMLGVEVVQDEFKDQLMHYIFNPNPSEEQCSANLLEQASTRTREVRQRVEQGRDRLMEINSFDRESADILVNQMKEWDENFEVSALVLEILEHLGVEVSNGTIRGTWILKPGEAMKIPEIPGLLEEGMTVTDSREIALSREDVHFLSIDHPLTLNTLELFLDSGEGKVQFSSGKGLKGGLYFEGLYTWELTQDPKWQLSHVFAPRTLRVLINQNSVDWSKRLEAFEELALTEGLGSALPNIEEKLADRMVEIRKGLENAAMDQSEILGKRVADEAKNALQGEIQRLKVLLNVDPERVGKRLKVLEGYQKAIEKTVLSPHLRLEGLRMYLLK